MTPRERFENTGKLTKSGSKSRSFHFWRIMGQVGFSGDKRGWATLTDGGNLMNHWLRVGSLERVEGAVLYEVIIWRVCIVFGIV